MRFDRRSAIFCFLALIVAAFNFACLQKGKAFALTAWDFTFLCLLFLPVIRTRTRKVIQVICFLGVGIGIITTGIRGYLWNCYGTTPDTAFALGALTNTNFNESLEFLIHDIRYISFWTFLTLFVTAVCGYLLGKFYKYDELEKPSVLVYLMLFCSLTVAVIGWVGTPMRKNLPPFELSFTISEYQKLKQEWKDQKSRRSENINVAASSIIDKTTDNETIVLVIGESMCRDNLSLYGYSRLTTPLLDHQAKSGDLLFIHNAWSTMAGTIAAFESMFNFPINIDGRTKELNLFAVFKAAGWDIYWISNQDDHAIDSMFATYADKTYKLNRMSGRSYQSLDEKVLPIFSEIMAGTKPGNRLIVVHLIGMHPKFNVRYPSGFQKKWSEEDEITKAFEMADRSDSTTDKRNEYDTALSYQDVVLNQLLEITKKYTKNKPTYWFYISDHSVETGDCFDRTGHKIDSITSYKIPFLLWSNQKLFETDAFKKEFGSGFRADWLYSTILEAAHINIKDESIPQKSVINPNYRFSLPDNIKRLQTSGCLKPLFSKKREDSDTGNNVSHLYNAVEQN